MASRLAISDVFFLYICDICSDDDDDDTDDPSSDLTSVAYVCSRTRKVCVASTRDWSKFGAIFDCHRMVVHFAYLYQESCCLIRF